MQDEYKTEWNGNQYVLREVYTLVNRFNQMYQMGQYEQAQDCCFTLYALISNKIDKKKPLKDLRLFERICRLNKSNDPQKITLRKVWLDLSKCVDDVGLGASDAEKNTSSGYSV